MVEFLEIAYRRVDGLQSQFAVPASRQCFCEVRGGAQGETGPDDGGGNAVVTVVGSGEILTVVTGGFGLIGDADFTDI